MVHNRIEIFMKSHLAFIPIPFHKIYIKIAWKLRLYNDFFPMYIQSCIIFQWIISVKILFMPADQGSEKVVAAAPDNEQTLETTSGKILLSME